MIEKMLNKFSNFVAHMLSFAVMMILLCVGLAGMIWAIRFLVSVVG